MTMANPIYVSIPNPAKTLYGRNQPYLPSCKIGAPPEHVSFTPHTLRCCRFVEHRLVSGKISFLLSPHLLPISNTLVFCSELFLKAYNTFETVRRSALMYKEFTLIHIQPDLKLYLVRSIANLEKRRSKMAYRVYNGIAGYSHAKHQKFIRCTLLFPINRDNGNKIHLMHTIHLVACIQLVRFLSKV